MQQVLIAFLGLRSEQNDIKICLTIITASVIVQVLHQLFFFKEEHNV